MNICGLKLSHDSSISLISQDKLVFSLELEKLNNNPRFSIIDDLSIIPEILQQYGYPVEKIDHFVVDGWIGEKESTILIKNNAREQKLSVAPYQEFVGTFDSLNTCVEGEMPLGEHQVPYLSFPHAFGHVMAAYHTSPFVKNEQSSYVLVWDGGMYPKLYFVDGSEGTLCPLGELFYFGVNIYSIFAQHYRPFKYNANVIKDELSIAGKVMAYAAFGEADEEIIAQLNETYHSSLEDDEAIANIPQYPYLFTKAFKARVGRCNYLDEDIIASFHEFISRLLIKQLSQKVRETGTLSQNLCFSGGAALNIKWNAAIRDAKLLDNLWICPFPNDSGSAIGAACCGYTHKTKKFGVSWNIYSGPTISESSPAKGWSRHACNISELAELIHSSQEPVIILQGRTELGPRALGNRSIVASCESTRIRDVLNAAKLREPYRPVAPICLEEFSPDIFTPGGRDPYMLYEHKVKPSWQRRIPGICHHDNTARLQTVNETDNPTIFALLTEYYKLSEIPVLCNTSANFKGSGFFPDIYSATKWGKINHVWSEGTLYKKTENLARL